MKTRIFFIMMLSWLLFGFSFIVTLFCLYHPHTIADWVVWARPVLLAIYGLAFLSGFVSLLIRTIVLVRILL